MIHKPQSKSVMRYAALKKENLRLQRKILTLEAKDVTIHHELLLRPAFSPPKKDDVLSVEAINKYLSKLPTTRKAGGTNAA